MSEKKKTQKKKSVRMKEEHIEALVEKLDRGEMVIHYEEIEHLHPDEILEIMEFLRKQEMDQAFEEVRKIYANKKRPTLEKPDIDLRVWSYFYDKRFSLLVSAAFTALFLPVATLFGAHGVVTRHAEKTGIELSATTVVPLVILALGLFAGRLVQAYRESSRSKRMPGSSRHRRALGLRVVTAQGKPLGFARSFLRGILRSFPFSPFMLLSIEVSANGRGLHDRIMGTYVIRQNGEVSDLEIAEFIRNEY